MKNKVIIGLDLSTTCTGYSIFENGKLIKFGRIKPKTTLDTIEKIEYISKELSDIFSDYKTKDSVFIIEDIFLKNFKGPNYIIRNQVKGFANLGRISGAVLRVIFEKGWTRANVKIRMAISARPMVGIKGNCKKAEVQSWVLGKFTNIENSEYEALIDAVMAKKQLNDISKAVYNKRMEEISKLIDKETGFGEDIADAILLGYGEVLNESLENKK